jgi:hypothetical protein
MLAAVLVDLFGCAHSAHDDGSSHRAGGDDGRGAAAGSGSPTGAGAFAMDAGDVKGSAGSTTPSNASITEADAQPTADAGMADGLADAGMADADLADAGMADAGAALVIGVNVHNYPKPTAYGYLAADGADRMGDGLTALAVRYVRGPTIGDTDFLTRLSSFGVTHVILGLDAKSYGMPFDAVKLKSALDVSLAEAKRLGLHVVVEGLNEWDLFNTRSYNNGVLPAGVDASAFVALTQKALYEAAHPEGVLVLGPSVGHGQDQMNLDFFPDVAADVDIVNMHLYFGQMPESLAVATIVANHEKFQGAGKPLWVTETGISAYGSVTEQAQADVITRGLTYFADSGLIDAVFIYQLIDQSEPGVQGTTFVPDSAEYHFGLFGFDARKKPAADAVKSALLTL